MVATPLVMLIFLNDVEHIVFFHNLVIIIQLLIYLKNEKIYRTMLLTATGLLSFSATSQVSLYTFSQLSGTYTAISGGTVFGTVSTDDDTFVNPASPLQVETPVSVFPSDSILHLIIMYTIVSGLIITGGSVLGSLL